MNKNLKSFHKLFFIVFFSFLFSSVVGSGNTPDLPDRIEPELEKIEALPRRTKPAELNIQVTKIKSEPLEEVYIDRKNKTIYVDFSKKREQALRGVKDAEDLEKKYDLVISENIQSSGEIVGKGRSKMTTNLQVMAYETTELDGKKMLKIPYQNEPEKLYISVQENNQVIKVYSMDVSKSTGVNGNISNNPLMINTTNWNEIIINDVENISNLIEFGRIGMEQTNQSPIYLGNPFPVIALGERGTLNNHTISLGWSFTSWEYSIPARTNKVISSYRNSTLNKNFTMEMSLENRVILSGYSRIERGDPVSIFGTFYPGTTEKITADLRGQLQDLDQLNSIFVELRNKNEREYTFSPLEPLENQISFVVSQAILSGYYYYDVPTKNGLTNGDKKIENRAYPNIKLVKPLIQETLTLNIGNEFNIDSNIVFTQNGINSIPGVSLTPTNTRNLKSLHFNGTYTLNNGNKIDIDTTGNSVANKINILNGLNILTLEIKYEGRYPKIKILNKPMAGTYKLNIKHYEPSGLERLNYNLDIVIKENFVKERLATITYLKGYDRLMLDKQGFEKINFDILGKPNVNTSINEYIKVDTGGEFISGLTGGSTVKIKNKNGELIKEISDIEKEIDLGEVKLFFSNQGLFSLQMKTVENQKIFEYIIEHYNNTELKLRDKLNIKAIQENVNDREVTLNYKGGYDHYFVKKVDIDSQGQITPGIPVELIRDNFPSGFITGLNTSPANDYEIKVKIIRLNLDGTDYIPREEKVGGIEESLIMNDFDLTVGKNGMSVIVKNLNNSNSYKYRIEQYIEVGGIRVLKNKDILNIRSKNINKEFEVTWNMKDIIIIPDPNGDPNKTKIEYPDNWVKITQLVDDKKRFPIIGINQVLGEMQNIWSLETQTPLNPINHKPFASLALTSSNGSNIKVPINIRETPFQKAEKFLVYDRGDMTNRNTAVGAYTPLNSLNISPLNNEVQVDFEMIFENIPTSQMETILKYAKEKFEQGQTKVEIPYLDSKNFHKILAIRGLQESTESNQIKYRVNNSNILTYGIVDFPKIYVIKDENMIESNTATLNFKNPVPKSNRDISGTFDIKNGTIEPNNLPEYNHPSSLIVEGLTSSWHGVANIPEYHKIKIYSGTDIGEGITPEAEFMTTENGEIKGVHTIKTKNNKYVFMKGKNTSLAVGVLEWNFMEVLEEVITLVHYNNVGRIIAKDIYKMNIEEFLPKKYLDVTNSTLINKIDINKNLKATVDARQDFIELGSLKLENYQKDITKIVEDTKGIKIEALSKEIILSSTLDNVFLKGNLKFDTENKEVLNPNESANLRFILSQESIDNIDNLVGKTFLLTTPLELIKISGGKKNEVLLKNLIITLSNAQSGDLSSMTYISTVTNLKIKDIDSIIAINKTKFDLDGQMTLRQINSGQGNSVPAIAIGDYDIWKFGIAGILKRDRVISKNNRSSVEVKYEIVGSNPKVEVNIYPELTKEKTKATRDDLNYPISKIKLYTEGAIVNGSERYLTALSYATSRDTMSERITTGLTLNITKDQMEKIKNELKNIKGDIIELKPVGKNAKISYIHGRDAGESGVSTNGNTLSLPADKDVLNKYTEKSLPSIFVDKEKLNKNLEINLLPTYPLKEEQEKIIFKSNTAPLYSVGKVIINPTNDNRAMEGLNYQHKIKLILPGGEIKEYATSLDGSITIKEIIEKNAKSITLNIDYKSGNEVHVWVTNRNGIQYYDLVLQHIDPSGDVRRTINLRINSGLEGSTSIKQGEMDLTISSRYNPIDGQLNSEPILITKDGIKYQTEVLDLKLLNGDYPIELKNGQKAYIKDKEILESDYVTVILEKGTVIKAKRERNGDLKIKPIYWNYNIQDEFILEYKIEDKITNQYKFNLKCPEFFVASSGVLDFGKLYKLKDSKDKTVTTNIELHYNTNVIAEYSLDISQGELNVGTDIFKNYLYLDDNKTLLVKDLFLGEELGKGTTKRTLSLTGTVHGPSILKAPEGKYEKTIQILIHLK
ncbi:hypothetical protein OQE61_04715 [Cetobacterium somerae]|uniref:hypothetical protein n=1 Tax=Cetobacterium somerae TaxID=188913 RepID=UPI00225809A2|nr:hypothetical protein [Cetobacterium somerae]MCX3066792.1 hypothetical protein [Cetobacterium somerae]